MAVLETTSLCKAKPREWCSPSKLPEQDGDLTRKMAERMLQHKFQYSSVSVGFPTFVSFTLVYSSSAARTKT